jgi:hypothetical protein
LINNRYYHGVNNSSFRIGYKKERLCSYVLFESRESTKYGSTLRGCMLFSCRVTPDQEVEFYTLENKTPRAVWHSPTLHSMCCHENTLQGILNIFVDRICRGSVVSTYTDLQHRGHYVTPITYFERAFYHFPQSLPHGDSYKSPAQLCDCYPLTYLISGDVKGKTRFKEVWRLQDICSFFVINFFYNDKTLVQSLLPTKLFKTLEEDSRYYTHRWRY